MISQLLGVLRCYIVIDLIGHYIRSSVYGQGVSAPPLLSDSLSRQILFGLLYAIRSYFDLAYGYHICAIVAVGMGLTEPALWPSLFGSFTEAYTMRKVWGKRHSLIPCHLHANYYISRVLLASGLSKGKADSGLLEALKCQLTSIAFPRSMQLHPRNLPYPKRGHSIAICPTIPFLLHICHSSPHRISKHAIRSGSQAPIPLLHDTAGSNYL